MIARELRGGTEPYKYKEKFKVRVKVHDTEQEEGNLPFEKISVINFHTNPLLYTPEQKDGERQSIL